ELIGEPRLLRNLGKDFGRRLLGVARPHQIEDAEFHFLLLCFGLVWPRAWPRYPRASSSELLLGCRFGLRRGRIGGISSRAGTFVAGATQNLLWRGTDGWNPFPSSAESVSDPLLSRGSAHTAVAADVATEGSDATFGSRWWTAL